MIAEVYEELGATDGTSEADGAEDGTLTDGAEDGTLTDGAVLPAGAAVPAGVDGAASGGAELPAGVLHATTAPPSEAAKAKASSIRLIMIEGYLRCQGAGGSGASRGRGDHEG